MVTLKYMEARQQHIADLARHILPFVEEQEQKGKLLKVFRHLLLLVLTAFITWSGAQYVRPITYAEEKSLRMLLEYSALKRSVPVNVETKQLLDHFQIDRLGEIRSYQWNEAVSQVADSSD
jgi:hypothetical protein